jgi:glycosyltransferase involved in cell wall biosynthesis
MISLITCAYRPEEDMFERVLRSIEQLKWPSGQQVEYIIVDNAGDLSEMAVMKDFLQRNGQWARIVHEKKAGLTEARLRGLEESNGEWMIFFDQDNEPAADYIIEASRLLSANPSVMVCGPGNVTVVFTGEADKWVVKHAKGMLQELHMQSDFFTTEPLRHDTMIPYGTGMIVRRQTMLDYSQKIRSGEYSGADRSAGNLNSGGDVQIVFCASTAGHSVGRSPSLSLNHLMPPSRSRFNYIKRFSYGNGLETFPVVAQAFPALVKQPRNVLYESCLFIYQSSREFFKWTIFQLNPRMTTCKIAALAAFKQGQYNYYNRRLPWLIRLTKKILNV